MFYTDGKLQFPVRVEKPDPLFARALQQAIGGVEGEIRVAMQYFFQACGARGNTKFRDLLMNTAAEELGHIEMLATAVALNLEGAPLSEKEAVSKDPVSSMVLGGINMKNILSAGLSAMPVDSDGVPFDMSHIYASGNIAADMTANVAAESTGRTLAVRLYNLTNDPGMKEMLSYLIARDTMHQNQWLAALEELGGQTGVFPIPNSFPQEQENTDFSYAFLGFQEDGTDPIAGRWSEGQSIDGKGKFSSAPMKPLGEKPNLGPAKPNSGAQSEQM
ncbi:manganese catalase family protein [Rhizobium sp. SSA_523]|uniref:manganese catalase family protein n=1 Tax=Rhizobium sp. SSA_523 TaxID=2952477 RepID=UPI002091BDDC|nr:manganese catalase family protein [Rhizobium sp. SSA_523]MCO5733087.1 manganese catalase family protein [Rhizobium sp. SSA_523]WKC23965.1 manganese catalase family protein [Rhizobium sp. SSA_523]